MKVLSLYDGVYHLIYPNKKKLCSAMMRFQEYYESPEFSGRIFTRGEFMRWYKKPYSWNGGNFPDYILNPFIDGMFDPLTKPEAEIVAFAERIPKNKKFYVILTHEEEPGAIDHEMAHALYYLNGEYKHQADKVLEVWGGHSKHVMRELLDKGYSSNVISDEIQAYSVCGSEKLKSTIAASVKHKMAAIYKKFI